MNISHILCNTIKSSEHNIILEIYVKQFQATLLSNPLQ